MKIEIGILSDSHLKEHELEFPKYKRLLQKLTTHFSSCDQIIHAGDVNAPQFIEDLQDIAPVNVVRGNTDSYSKWAKKLDLELGTLKVGVAHDPNDVILFDLKQIQVFIHGHTHMPAINRSNDGTLFFCPGAISNPRASAKKLPGFESGSPKPTIGFLIIEDEILSTYIRPL